MSIHKIVFYPGESLRQETKEITEFDDALKLLIDDMFETMYHARGVGLAAPQIGISKKVAVIDVTDDKSQQLVLINPEIIAHEGSEIMQEGCLSVPSVFDTVSRWSKVTMRAQDADGAFYEMTADGLLGEAIQHEIDHLHGKLFIDRLSKLKRTRAIQKLEKYLRKLSKSAQ